MPTTKHNNHKKTSMNIKVAIGLATVSIVALAGTARAVIPEPVWEHLITEPMATYPIPAMTNFLGNTTDSDAGDGKSVISVLGPIHRYDANRLLLGIRENGVNESEPNLTAAQLWVSTNYPDRSLIWINPTNGQPMGLALTVGLYPVALDQWFIDASLAVPVPNGDYTNQYYWGFDVSDDGYVYTTYKNKVLRYAPNGSGGITPTPQVVLTMDPTNTTVHGNLYTVNGYLPVVRVRGSGVNTVILTGGLSGNRGAFRLVTTNGNDFFATSWMPSGWGNLGSGVFSELIPSQDPNAQPGDDWVFGGWFPGASCGADSGVGRMFTGSPYNDPTNNFVSTGYAPQSDTTTQGPRFANKFIGTVGANSNYNYVVVYQTPSWNSAVANGGRYDPGFLGVLDANSGAFSAAYELNVTEQNALLTADGTAKWEATFGFVDLKKLPNGDAELLWCSGVYGYGRYIMKPVIRITSIEYTSYPTIYFTGDGNGQLQRTTSLASPQWVDVENAAPPGTAINDVTAPAGGAYYRMKLVP